MRIGDRKNVKGLLMQFSGYPGIWRVFATSLFIIWQIVSTSSVGRLQGFIHIAKSEMDVHGNIDAHSSVTQTGMFHIKNNHLSLMFLHVPTSTRSPLGRLYSTRHTNTADSVKDVSSRFCQRCFTSLTESACMPYYYRP